jgi:tetratricopeptide (TPR) repeat protein
MRFLHICLLLYLGSLLPVLGEAPSAETLFFEANVRAAEEDYAAAIPLYEAALAQRPSANLHYNLGNAYYHTGDWGRARIHWERALAIQPRHSSARHNLLVLLQEQKLPHVAPGVGERFARLLSLNQWIWSAAFAFWILLAAVVGARWRKSAALGAIAGVGAASLVACLIAIFALNPRSHPAILLEDQAPLRVAPTPASPIAAILPSAHYLHILEPYGEFFRVRLNDGREGFLKAAQVERIR